MNHYIGVWNPITRKLTTACGQSWPAGPQWPVLKDNSDLDCRSCIQWMEEYGLLHPKGSEHHKLKFAVVKAPSSPKDWVPGTSMDSQNG